MRRRAFLTLAAGGTLAGCSGLTNERFRTFRDRLGEEGVDVVAAAAEERRWVIEYIPRQGTGDDRIQEVATIAELYAQETPSAGENADHRRLDIIILDGEETRQGSLSVSAQAARQYRNNEITWERYFLTVLQTVRESGQSNVDLPTGRGTSDNESRTPTPTPTLHPLGETVVLDTEIAITPLEVRMNVTTDELDAGEQLVRVVIQAENRGDSPTSAPYFSDFAIVVGDRQYASTQFTTYQEETRDLLPGKSSQGWIEFAIPADTTVTDLQLVLVTDDNVVRWR